jgi:fatty-acid desaturase
MLGVCNAQDSPPHWVAVHRKHHHHTDDTDDPHSPLVWAHMGWLLVVVEANSGVTWVHTVPTVEEWSSITERGPDEVLTTPTLPGFAIRLGEID